MKRSGGRWICWALLALSGISGGCERPDSAGRQRVRGRVSFAGNPVNFGEVLLTPDPARGGSGPQGLASIVQGSYDTRGSRAPGVGAGAVVARVTAFGAATGPVIAEHEVRFEVPAGGTEQDIEIPASAAVAAKPDI